MKILTANRLLDGEAVWYAHGRWAETIEGAEIAADKAGEERLDAVGKAAFAANLVLDVALLGRSDETPDQRFALPGAPARDGSVEVYTLEPATVAGGRA